MRRPFDWLWLLDVRMGIHSVDIYVPSGDESRLKETTPSGSVEVEVEVEVAGAAAERDDARGTVKCPPVTSPMR